MMFTIERRRGTIEPARLCIAWPIEPKPDMERVGRGEAHKRIKPKNLVEKNGPDCHRTGAIGADVDVRLIPSEPEAGEAGIGRAVGQLIAFLNGKEVEIQARLEAAQIQDQRIIERAARDSGSRSCRLAGLLEAGFEGLVREKAKARGSRQNAFRSECCECCERNYNGTFPH